MSEHPDPQNPSTSEAVAAMAQSRTGADSPAISARPKPRSRKQDTGAFTVGAGVERSACALPYERQPGDPIYRPLRIYTLDPALSQFEGQTAIVNIPYEPLQPGPVGRVFRVDNKNRVAQESYRRVNLDDPRILIEDGRLPSPTDPRFHQQMVYAVSMEVYTAFRRALGRNLSWGFERDSTDHESPCLLIQPHSLSDANAYYDPVEGALKFGYYTASKHSSGRNIPGQFVFTCLSHDVIAHEVTHAILDGLRTHLDIPTNPDVLAFHEAFADLVAVFQHFAYKEVVLAAIHKSRGSLAESDLLTGIANQFGQTTREDCRSLRTAVDAKDQKGNPVLYDPSMELHELGSVLVSAVFDAFLTIFKRKTARLVRLATGGTGISPPGELPPDLQDLLAEEASKLASQFLSICIRAIDYCPPVDIEFGEYLRAMITADFDLVPSDPWGYREALIDGFRRREIYPPKVASLSTDSLLWKRPERDLDPIDALSFKELQFDGDPGRPAGADELRRQACAIGDFITRPKNLPLFGLAVVRSRRSRRDAISPPVIESIRSARRIGPDGQIIFDLIVEVILKREVAAPLGNDRFIVYGGSTIILGPRGEIRYVIAKNILSEERLHRNRAFVEGPTGRRFWQNVKGVAEPKPLLFKFLHS